jgi:uncharacterized protein (TIGR02996 family)
MHPVLRDLLAAAREDPEEDGPLLVLADWLEEHGDRRGEFVRLQVLLDRLDPDDPAVAAAKKRHDELRAQYGPFWLGPLAAVGSPVRYARGLVDLYVLAEDFPGEEFAEAARSDEFAWVNAVHLVLEGATIRQVNRVLSSPALAAVGGLRFGGGLRDRGLRQLASTPHAAGLRRLELSDNGITAGGLRALAESPHLSRLSWLDLSSNEISRAGFEALAGSPLLGRLLRLRLTGCQMNRADARVLAGFEGAARLSELRMGSNAIAAEGTAALAGAALLDQVERLDLGDNKVGDRGAAALAASPHLAALTRLDLRDNGIGTKGALALAGSSVLQRLTRLSLTGNGIGSRGASALRARFPFVTL